MMIQCTSYGRCGLLGNPSDGYYGKTISLAMADFPATVTIFESPEINLEPNDEDGGRFPNLDAMVHEIDHFGYYGGIRLLKATCHVFHAYCREHSISLPERNFTMRYRTTVPRLVGLGGSSAICTATLKALQAFYGVEDIPLELAPTLCWQAEQDLSIQCGLQDRVIQIYNGLVYMDFSEDYFKEHNHGIYERLDPALLPNVYMAYDPCRAEFSGIYHKKLKMLYESKAGDILAAMSEFAEYAEQGRTALLNHDTTELNRLINANFDLRCRVLNVSEQNYNMVMTARKSGASAKFAGSGGAIIGCYQDQKMFDVLKRDLEAIGCAIVKPTIAT